MKKVPGGLTPTFGTLLRFGVQSGDFGYIARESCRGDGLFVSRPPESCMGRRSCRRSALLGPLPFRRAGQELALQAPAFPPSLRPSCSMASLAMDPEMHTLLPSSMVAWPLTALSSSMTTWRLTGVFLFDGHMAVNGAFVFDGHMAVNDTFILMRKGEPTLFGTS